MNYDKLSLELHEKHVGKLEVTSKVKLENRDDLSIAYTPGVAEPCRRIAENPDDIYKYTAKPSLVAIVSDGSAVLGLGNIGGKASMPVMEGKAILFKEFGNIDGFPICLDTQDTEEIINTVKNIAPTFGGINLEDISAPRCFEIEDRLKEMLDIPVFHDDQHGTAVVVLAGLINACKLTGKDPKTAKIVMNGIGAAGSAIARILLDYGCENMLLCGRPGIINRNEPHTMKNWMQEKLALRTNHQCESGSLADALKGADIFIGVSSANIMNEEMIKGMNPDPLIFALANPVPEIDPEIAKAAGAAVVCTGRSDCPNQVNNVLAFPGIFKGAFSVRASQINEEMKIAAAHALANMVSAEELNADFVIPNPLNREVADIVAKAVAEAAVKSGVARI